MFYRNNFVQHTLYEVIRQNHVQYPAEAKAKEQAGKVFVKFWVGISGQVKNAEVVRSSGYKLLDHEAIRVVNSLPVV